jgi:hypothetical protein
LELPGNVYMMQPYYAVAPIPHGTRETSADIYWQLCQIDGTAPRTVVVSSIRVGKTLSQGTYVSVTSAILFQEV